LDDAPQCLRRSPCPAAAIEQQPFDAVLYEQTHAEAIALATKVDRGEMSREDAILQLVQMQLTTMEPQQQNGGKRS
jgi:hypothetical protein